MPVEIRAIEGPLPEKMADFVFSDLPKPLQKHNDSLNTPIAVNYQLKPPLNRQIQK